MSSKDDDPLRHADVGETVTVRESKILHSINGKPDVFWGTDRQTNSEVEIAELELTDDGDIRVTWEAEMTKRLPRNWDYCEEPLTEEEAKKERRKSLLEAVGKAIPHAIALSLIGAVTVFVFNAFPAEMIINGEPVGAPGSADFALVLGLIISMIWWVQRMPRRLNGGEA